MSTFKARIVSAPSAPRAKSNGGESVGIQAEILEGPAKGHIVWGTRTTKNAEGKEKDIPKIGDEVILHYSTMPSTKEPGKFQAFFEIATGANVTDNDALVALLGTVEVDQQA